MEVMFLKRAEIKAVCPYFRRLGDRCIHCRGLTSDGGIAVSFGEVSERDKYFRRRCALTRWEECPIAGIHTDKDKGAPAVPSRSAAQVREDCDKLKRRTVVLSPDKFAAFEAAGRVTVWGGMIYDVLFGAIEDGEPFFCTVIPAGEETGRVVIATVYRGMGDGINAPIGEKAYILSFADRGTGA